MFSVNSLRVIPGWPIVSQRRWSSRLCVVVPFQAVCRFVSDVGKLGGHGRKVCQTYCESIISSFVDGVSSASGLPKVYNFSLILLVVFGGSGSRVVWSGIRSSVVSIVVIW